jgi:predicted nucleic acid-binding protein
MTTKFFFDTYSLVEILEKNKSYEPYLDFEIIMTKLNLFEFYFYLLRTANEHTAQKWLVRCSKFVVDFDDITIAQAAKFKSIYKKCSMTDCIGYITAQRLGIPFLTGDKEFEKIRGVEFVK